MYTIRTNLFKIYQVALALVLALSVVLIMAPETASASGYGCSNYYKVRKGDTLSEIAKRHGVNYHNLAYANGIKNPNHIYYGQKLCISGGGHSGYHKSYTYHKPYYKHSYYKSYNYHKPYYNYGYHKKHYNYGYGHGYGYHKSYYNKHHYGYGHYNKHYNRGYGW